MLLLIIFTVIVGLVVVERVFVRMKARKLREAALRDRPVASPTPVKFTGHPYRAGSRVEVVPVKANKSSFVEHDDLETYLQREERRRQVDDDIVTPLLVTEMIIENAATPDYDPPTASPSYDSNFSGGGGESGGGGSSGDW